MARGGYRPNSGPAKGTKYAPRGSRKAKQKEEIPDDIKQDAEKANMTPLEYMLFVMRDETVDLTRRDRMAVAAAPYVHSRVGEQKGKKEEKQDRAERASKGRFAPSKPPLSVVK